MSVSPPSTRNFSPSLTRGNRSVRERARTSTSLSICSPNRLQSSDSEDRDGIYDFIAKRRAIGFTRMTLASCKREIARLDAEMERAERRIVQMRDQLAGTRNKFNDYIRMSSMEQDASIKRASMETKAKQEKIQEVKRLRAEITIAELDRQRHEEQVAKCKTFKHFLDSLTPPTWLRETLTEILIEKEKIHISEEIDNRIAKEEDDAVCLYPLAESNSLVVEEADTKARLERAQTLAAEINTKFKEASDRIKGEIETMPLQDIQARLNELDSNLIPMYFREPEQILDKFFDTQEGNLFLIQNCQELEEDIESMNHKCIANQRETVRLAECRATETAALTESIAEEQTRLDALNQRLERAMAIGASKAGELGEMKEQIETKVRQVYTSVSGESTNVDVISMLVVMERKLLYALDFITNKENAVDTKMVQKVLKQRDKERRLAARIQVLTQQSAELEKRTKLALERTQLPAVRRIWKPVMWRSKPISGSTKQHNLTQRPGVRTEDDEFFT